MEQEQITRIANLFVKAAEKYRRIEETPVMMDDGTKVYGSEMHMAVAVGEGRARTGTDLVDSFGVTRGAVSQAVNRLEEKGILIRAASEADAKTLIISLTKKGQRLVALHAELHGKNAAAVKNASARYGPEKLAVIEAFLEDLSGLLDSCIAIHTEAAS